jgi:hypothetical protein
MPTQLGVFASLPLPKAVATDADTGSPISSIHESAARDKWQAMIDYRLIEWPWDQSQLDDDETPAASRETIQLAIRVAERLRDNGSPAPTRIVPDAHGGIVFERAAGNLFESYRISPDGSVEYCGFEDCRLVQRHWLDL